MTFTIEQVREIAGQAAGAASGVFLRKHPDEVMPTEEVGAAVDAVLRSFGVDPDPGAAGYSRDQLVGQAHYPEARGLTVDEPTLLDRGDGSVKVRMCVRIEGRIVAVVGGVGLRLDGLELLRAARDARLRVLRGDALELRVLFPDPDLRERIASAAA